MLANAGEALRLVLVADSEDASSTAARRLLDAITAPMRREHAAARGHESHAPDSIDEYANGCAYAVCLA
jgi:hypothetical protein